LKKYKHLFFDLDRTLWDFDKNSRLALEIIYVDLKLDDEGLNGFESFIGHYHDINAHCWDLYRKGLMTKDDLRFRRFDLALRKEGITDVDLSIRIADAYVEIAPKMTSLVPGASELLNHISGKYKLHIITNGFPEVQRIKMRLSGLKPHFDRLIISEEIGYSKPHPEIFRQALVQTRAKASDSLMIGDDLHVDAVGATTAGIDAVFYNPEGISHEESVAYDIRHLDELKDIL